MHYDRCMTPEETAPLSKSPRAEEGVYVETALRVIAYFEVFDHVVSRSSGALVGG